MEKKFGLDQIDTVAAEVLEAVPHRVILLDGEMGAGKTTFIKALCKRLGVVDAVSSPTFSLINEYRTDDDEPVYHFDAYRLKDEAEAVAAGLDEYLDSGHWCFVEWAGKIPRLIPESHAVVALSIAPDGSRRLVLT